MEILFETDYTRIEYDSENEIVILCLIGNIAHEDYKTMWNTTFEKVQEKQAIKLIADQTLLEKSSMESKAWLVAKWFPKTKKELRDDMKVAMVTSKSLFTRIGGEYIVNAVRSMSKFDIKIFKNIEAAYEWINK